MGILQYMEYYAWTIPLTIRSYVNEGEVNQYLQQAPVVDRKVGNLEIVRKHHIF